MLSLLCYDKISWQWYSQFQFFLRTPAIEGTHVTQGIWRQPTLSRDLHFTASRLPRFHFNDPKGDDSFGAEFINS